MVDFQEAKLKSSSAERAAPAVIAAAPAVRRRASSMEAAAQPASQPGLQPAPPLIGGDAHFPESDADIVSCAFVVLRI